MISVGGVNLTVKQTVKQIVPIDMNTEIPKFIDMPDILDICRLIYIRYIKDIIGF